MSPAQDLCMWPHPVTPARGLCAAQLDLQNWVDWSPLHDFAKSATFLERQKSIVSARDVSRDFFYWRRASLSINLVCLLGWPFYNSKSSKPNGSASLFGRKNKRLLVTSSELSVLLMQWLDLGLVITFVKIPHYSSVAKMSLFNKP